VKSLGKFPDRFVAEISGQPDALRRAARGLEEQAAQLSDLRGAAAAAPAILFTGMGSSYDACYPAVTALSLRGVSCSMLDTAELLHFRLPALRSGTLLICVSQSGESAELVRLVEVLPASTAQPTLASITNGSANTLASAAAIAIDTRAGEEYGPSTMTFATALAVLDSLVDADPPIERAALELDRLTAEPEQSAGELCTWIDGRPNLALVGRGSARAAAEMGALTLKEAARMPAESLQAAQFRHGPLELAGPKLAVIVIATEPRTRDLELGLAGELVRAGAAVLVISQDGEAPDGALAIPVGPLTGGLAAAAATVPAQLLAWRLARSRGLTPGEFALAGKVTTRE
jgi:glucosamine--fructose-6-phosphate aminotransferase (isomerizing)